MKVRTVAALSGLAMMLSSVSVWSLTDPERKLGSETVTRAGKSFLASDDSKSAQFSAGDEVRLEGRLGHTELAARRSQDTFALFTVRGQEAGRSVSRAPMHLAIVIDRSGSMAGKRLDNALSAARGAIARLSSDDMVSVIDYSTTARVLVSPTALDDSARARVQQQLSTITASGDTCISCGLKSSIDTLRGRSGMVDRVLLLSDGEPTTGVRDAEGLRLVADDVRRAGASVTTIGVDVEYNERIMADIAQQSNGRHYFVDNPSGLSQIFERELEGLERTVAREASLTLEAPRGVELVEVMDRAFRREGDRLVVDVGTVAAGEEKTVLVRVRVRDLDPGNEELVFARLDYEDIATARRRDCSGTLAASFVDEPESVALDPLVEERVRRSSTLGSLTEANRLFQDGDAAAAARRVRDALSELESTRQRAVAAAPAAKKKAVDEQFARQERALGSAASAFAAPPAEPGVSAQDSREGRAAVRRNQEAASELAF